MSSLRDPIVVDPPGYSQRNGWIAAAEAVNHPKHANGETNWKAAFAADPGVCSCPCCGATYWAWGKRQRCIDCSFEYPTDWWCMYAWGCHAANRPVDLSRLHAERIAHPYYRYGFEHPVDEPWEERLKINWRNVLEEPAK